MWTAAGFQVGALPGREHTAALCLLWEWALVGPTVSVHRPSLPLADVSIEDVLNVLHYEVYSNCREEWESAHIGFLGYLENVEHPALFNSSFNKPLNKHYQPSAASQTSTETTNCKTRFNTGVLLCI